METKIGALMIRELEDQFLPILRKCLSMKELKKIHARMLRYSLSQSNFLVTKMVDFCNVKGEIEYAYLLFKQVVEPNIFLYNALIRAYTNNHFHEKALIIYKQMTRGRQRKNTVFPDRFTFPILIKACAGLLLLDLGKQIHGHVFKCGLALNSVIENSLMDMYTKCASMSNAHRVFEKMTERDTISWNTIISGYARLGQLKRARSIFDSMADKTIISWTTLISGYTWIGCYTDALDVFRQMQFVGIKPDEISIVSILPACAQLGALELGKWIHAYADKNGLLKNTFICNALIEMYAKCGSIDEASHLFSKMSYRDVISWSTMIGGLANHGKALEAIELFAEMKRDQVAPNSITFLGLLSACAHAGFLTEGLWYFDSMRMDYHIDPGVEHYGCMVDLLGRSGSLDQALEFIKKMSVAPDSTIWGSLLSSCRTHGNLEIAVIAMENLIVLEPDDPGNYVLLSNIYAELGRWDDVSRMRKLIRNRRTKKPPGCSLIEVNNVVQEFIAGDHSKPFSHEIMGILKLLAIQQSSSITETETLTEGIANL
ncbi:pentatricopeptide repeat-containing protein At2g20540 [Macadamia integrifolia]|uniref:pentatricopeptide repeat-containing protein At2g20540 n=1 Tax=Macadamia integrifolia TaxID=60698 RepID=UPI001C4E82D6|nr:pentatricopeptide repeat-containing protein At2g20540 [Macadamia integrifolia]XP_042476618.1 pentatricopeptide repeat-containing protein At2g20540 [Macadamia integrifolia]XP_042476623.1 pentatricopeptide repeat-containing protein At2g20540 [Macadamia integrifolia]XP_042476632.1 pentatricopeptide repeat-containing protein At2g20540 [Macadamia integrifolia]XP_042476640.1 pentatricopeptide repeat-containing protein At2g20540 [Macadamia integrifolia]